MSCFPNERQDGEVSGGGNERGTRFRIFAQPSFLQGYETPETIRVSLPPSLVHAGPADERMVVIDAIGKAPYELDQGPPYDGPQNPPVQPNAQGHFDDLDPASRAFGAAHLYAVVRLVLDVWERYLGHPIVWHFETIDPRLELFPFVLWDNAQAGFGFLETGRASASTPSSDGSTDTIVYPFCLNFDVVAHETGHLILFSLLGVPGNRGLTSEYLAYHESASDTVALISALHSPKVVTHVLAGCGGNLYGQNELNRLAELSQNAQIRIASHGLRMSDVPDPQRPWYELSQKDRHRLGQPFTGATFDALVEIFQELLVERGLISRRLADDATRLADGTVPVAAVQDRFEAAYAAAPEGFHQALLVARDIIGLRLARAWDRIPANGFHFADMAATLLTVDRELSGDRYQQILLAALQWRQIGYGYDR